MREAPFPALSLALTVAAGCGLFSADSHAESSPYFLGVSQLISRDNNVLRLGDGDERPGFVRSDTVSSTSLLGGFDQPFGRQRVYADLAVRNNRYQNNSIFNNLGYTAKLGLDWSTVERVSGTVVATTNRSLSSFNVLGVGLLTQKNLETTKGLDNTVRVGIVTRYTFEASYGIRRVSNSLQNATVLARDFDQDTGSLGVRWAPREATTLGLALREVRGRYPRYLQLTDGSFLADRYKQDALDLTGTLKPSGASDFDFRVSQSRTRYDLNQQRDFTGVTGTVGWSWSPTGKLRVSSRLNRDTGQDSYAVTLFPGVPGNSDYSQVQTSLRLQTEYTLSAKILVTAAGQVVQRKLVQTLSADVLPAPLADATGSDRSTVLSLGARWAPRRSVILGCDLSTERRTANGPLTAPLKDRTVSCFGQFQLQK